MTKNIRTQTGKIIGKTLNAYHSKLKPKVDDLKFKEQYQGRIIDCMVGEIDDNYIETPETDAAMVKLEHSKEGVIKVPSIKGKTILVDVEGNETDTPAEGCRLVSVGEDEGNKLIILSNNPNLLNKEDYPSVLFGKTRDGLTFNVLADGKVSIKGTNTRGITLFCDKEYVDLLEDGVRYIHQGDGVGIEVTHFDNTKRWGSFTFNKSTMKSVRPYFQWSKIQAYDVISEPYFGKESEFKRQYIQSKHHKTEILLDEPLRKLPNGVCDEIVGNKLIKRVGKVTFNGSENWLKYGAGENDDFITFVFSLTCTNKHLKSKQMWAQQQRNRGRSNCLPSIGDKVYFNTIDTEGFCQGHNDTATTNNWCIAISKSKLTTIDINGFKKWLSENPVTIIYELAEPAIIEMPNTLTLQGFDDATMYIENEITPTVQYGYNALIPYKKELEMQQQEVETNTLDIERNIIPYLMDMEMNLMLMED